MNTHCHVDWSYDACNYQNHQGQVYDRGSYHTALRGRLIAQSENEPSNQIDGAECNSKVWEHQAWAHDDEGCDCDLLEVVLVSALVKVELKPIFVAELVGVDPVSAIWIPTLRNLLFDLFEMLYFKMLVHKLLVKQSPSLSTSGKSNKQALERDCASDGQHIWVLVGKSYWDMGRHFKLII